MWDHFSGKPVWRYPELPPFLLPKLVKDLPAANDSELSRVIWFWLRRPKSKLYETVAAFIVEGVCVVLSLITTFGGWPEISGSELSIELISPLFAVTIEIGAIMHRDELIRWRREYELSIDRLIRTIHPAV